MYGSSRFIGGIMSDRANPRYFMGIGLIFTGIINIFLAVCRVNYSDNEP